MATPERQTTGANRSIQSFHEPAIQANAEPYSSVPAEQHILSATPEELTAWQADVKEHGWKSMEVLKAKYGLE